MLLICCACVLAAGAGTIIAVRNGRVLDDDFCTKGCAPSTHISMVIDLTDTMSDEQYRSFLEELTYQRNHLEVGDRLSLYAIRGKGFNKVVRTEVLFSKCRPRDGSRADMKTENPRKLKKQFEEEFIRPLDRAVDSIDTKRYAEKSPILETLRTIAFDPSFTKAQNRKLILFSNLLENSEQVCHYKPGWENFERLQNRSLRVLDVEKLFNGVEVTVFLIPDDKQTGKLEKWWEEYFKYTGVKHFELKRL